MADSFLITSGSNGDALRERDSLRARLLDSVSLHDARRTDVGDVFDAMSVIGSKNTSDIEAAEGVEKRLVWISTGREEEALEGGRRGEDLEELCVDRSELGVLTAEEVDLLVEVAEVRLEDIVLVV